VDRSEAREALTGPFPSVSTLFCKDGSIDVEGMRNLVEFLISHGSKTLLLTYGDSLMSLLTDDEIAQVTKLVAEQAAGRACVVAADRQWATPKEVEFAKYAREVGADILMVLPPDWAGSCTVETMVDHYAAVAGEIPMMVVTAAFPSRGAEFGFEVLGRLIERTERMVAIKDDFCGVFGRKIGLRFNDRVAIASGGQKQNFLDAWPYGVDGYLSTHMRFKPEIAKRFWGAIEAKDVPAAREIIRVYDMPFFDFVMTLPGNFDAGIHAAYELFGVGQRWRRPPYYSLNDEEVERLAAFFREKSLL